MSKNLSNLGFRSGFYIEDPSQGRGHILMRVAIPCEQKALEKFEWEMEGKKGILDRFNPLSSLAVLPNPEIKTGNQDITQTDSKFHVVDFRFPIKKEENGLIALDPSRPDTVDKIGEYASFQIAVYHAMQFKNPRVSEEANTEAFLRLSEKDQLLLNMLKSIDFSVNDVKVQELVGLPPIEKFLDDNHLGFNALNDAVVRNRVSTETWGRLSKAESMPVQYCRSEDHSSKQYEFKSVSMIGQELAHYPVSKQVALMTSANNTFQIYGFFGNRIEKKIQKLSLRKDERATDTLVQFGHYYGVHKMLVIDALAKQGTNYAVEGIMKFSERAGIAKQMCNALVSIDTPRSREALYELGRKQNAEIVIPYLEKIDTSQSAGWIVELSKQGWEATQLALKSLKNMSPQNTTHQLVCFAKSKPAEVGQQVLEILKERLTDHSIKGIQQIAMFHPGLTIVAVETLLEMRARLNQVKTDNSYAGYCIDEISRTAYSLATKNLKQEPDEIRKLISLRQKFSNAALQTEASICTGLIKNQIHTLLNPDTLVLALSEKHASEWKIENLKMFLKEVGSAVSSLKGIEKAVDRAMPAVRAMKSLRDDYLQGNTFK